MATLESRLARLARDWTADLVIIDYLALLRPENRHRDLRESLVEILQEAGQLATTYNGGLGVPVLVPWQIRRDARDEASKRGGYILPDLSETAEASNTGAHRAGAAGAGQRRFPRPGGAAEAVGAEKPGWGAWRRAAGPYRRLRDRFLRPGRPGYQS